MRISALPLYGSNRVRFSFEEHRITDHYTYILDGTDDIDYPNDYENFKKREEDIDND